VVLMPETREELHRRIASRFTGMMAAGFLAEVEKLHARPDLGLSDPAVRAVGYRQLWQLLEGEFDLNEAVKRAIIASRQLAKRQLTWLRSLEGVQWFTSDTDGLSRARRLFMQRFASL